MHRLRFDSCAADCNAAAASFMLCSLLFGSPAPGCCAACWAAAAAQTAGSTPGGGGINGGNPGTNPKGGIIGKGAAFGGVGAFAGAGAAAAFSFLTFEAGFLGMVPWARWRRCAWVGGRECRFDARLQSCLVRKGAAARRRGKRGDARWATSWRCAQTRVGARRFWGCPLLSLCGPGPSWLEFTVFD